MNRAITTEELHELMESNHERLKEVEPKITGARLGREVVAEIRKQEENAKS